MQDEGNEVEQEEDEDVGYSQLQRKGKAGHKMEEGVTISLSFTSSSVLTHIHSSSLCTALLPPAAKEAPFPALMIPQGRGVLEGSQRLAVKSEHSEEHFQQLTVRLRG
ncbi:hypothetical protein INR49_018129 [Caranx melampygus]|nr:hypothetical protein INR49_018129 [Caranx melampygus]